MCTGCSLCWDFCPRGGLRYEALWPPSTVEGARTPTVAPAQVTSDSSDTYWKITGGPPADGLGAVVESYAVRASGQARRRPGRRGGERTADRAAGGRGDRRRAGVQAERRPRRTVEGNRHRSPPRPSEIRAASGSFYNQTMALAELDLVPLRPAAQAAYRRRGHALRGAGAPRHAGSPLADRGAPGRRGRAEHRADVHEELRLRGARRCGSCATSGVSTSTGSPRWT